MKIEPGAVVTLQKTENRADRNGRAIAPCIYEVSVRVESVYRDFGLINGEELSRYAYVQGYRDNGCNLPQKNPYGPDGRHRDSIFLPGGTNSYIVTDDCWRVIGGKG